MQEVARELHAIKQAYKEAMEGQKYSFQMELEKVREGFQREIEKVRRELHQVQLHWKILVLCQEIESSTGIQLKIVLYWLISESRLEKRLESSTGRGFAIVIIVSTNKKAAKLCSKGLRFGGILKVVEKYWEVGPGLICLSCEGIGHNHLGKCEDRAVKCIICADAYKVEDYKCRVIGCIVKIGKICTHITPKCANCGAKH